MELRDKATGWDAEKKLETLDLSVEDHITHLGTKRDPHK